MLTRRLLFAVLFMSCSLGGFFSNVALAVPADPTPFVATQPDGLTLTLHPRGDEFGGWLTDSEGHLVVQNKNGEYRYGLVGTDGRVEPSSLVAGRDKPSDIHLATNQNRVTWRDRLKENNTAANIKTPTTGTLKNLVILCRFNDHTVAQHCKPATSFDILMNAAGGDPTIAPSGSVNDYYSENSYGALDVVSTVVGWVTLPNNEAYYGNGASGMGSRPNAQTMVEHALAAADPLVNFSLFDDDNDNWIDAITIIHSGYGAEASPSNTNRIWSHKWAIPTFTSAEGVRVSKYYTAPALGGSSGSNITTIGVICHELGHFLGLPDLYDTTDTSNYSEGIGKWGVMGSGNWGFDGGGLNPVHFCAWSKIFLGWVEPVVVDRICPQTLVLNQIVSEPEVIKLTYGFPAGEFILLENLTNDSSYFNRSIPNDGLAVWHIDENVWSNNIEGYPGQAGWPENGNHYKVALLQADGDYDLEHSLNNRGDSGDLYASGSSDIVSHQETVYPNTYAYKNNNYGYTGIKLSNMTSTTSDGYELQVDYEVVQTAGTGQLTDVTSQAFTTQVGHNYQAAFGDYDNDGWDDIYACGEDLNGPDQVVRNNGNGQFLLSSTSPAIQGASVRSPHWIDYNNDGYMDLYAIDQDVDVMATYNGTQFVAATPVPDPGFPLRDSYSSWADVEPDGDLDLYLTCNETNILYYNDGNNQWREDSTAMPGHTTPWLAFNRPSWIDFDLDGDMDLYLPHKTLGDILYMNTGNGKFVDVHSTMFVQSLTSSCCSWGDYDNDGYLDVALFDNDTFRIFRNITGTEFIEVYGAASSISFDKIMDICWADFNNDGFLDLALAGPDPCEAGVFTGDGSGYFTELAGTGPGRVWRLAVSDYDNDGDMDILTTFHEWKLLRNDGLAGTNHWLQIALTGQASNRSAIGARVVLNAGGKVQTRVVGAGGSSYNQCTKTVAFGLGSTTQITSAKIYWPSGIEQDITSSVTIDSRNPITEPNHIVTAQITSASGLVPVAGNPLYGCPAGDGHELVITVDFDDAFASGTILASDMDILIENAGYEICGGAYDDTDGTSSNGYTVTLKRKHFSGCSGCVGDNCNTETIGTPLVRLEHNGLQVGAFPDLVVRTPDIAKNGTVDILDYTTFQQIFNSDPTTCVDLAPDGVYDLLDVTRLTTHWQHSCPVKAGNYSFDATYASLVTTSPSNSDDNKFSVAIEVTSGVDALSLQIPIGGNLGISSWEGKSDASNVAYVPQTSQGHGKLLVLITNLSDMVGQRLELLDLVAENDNTFKALDFLDNAYGTVLTSDGSVIEFAGMTSDSIQMPTKSMVHSVFPNPFNPAVTIQYSVAQASHVSIDVFDVSGRLVRTLVNEQQTASRELRSVMWDGQTDQGVPVSSGVYFWRMKTNQNNTSGRMMLVK